MTVRKRLYISNILMLVIPAVISVLALAAGVLAVLTAASPGAEHDLASEHELGELRTDIAGLAEDWLTAGADAARLESASESGGVLTVIERGGEEAARFGSGTEAAALDAALAALDGEGTVSDGETELYGELLDGGAVRIYNPVVDAASGTIRTLAAVFAVLVVAVALLSVLLTNRFLTRFVFRHISGPLLTLSEGVRQIRDGNLDFRIEYANPDEFKPVCEDFNDMAGRLKEGVERSRREEESRKELMAGISHDLRSPLTSIRAYVEGLLDGVADTPEKRERYLRTVNAKAGEMDSLLGKLFMFSKLDMGGYPYSPERLDAAREIRDFAAASSEDYARRGLEVRIGAIPGAAVDADPICLRSILMNLLDNSAKYKNKPAGTVSISGEIENGRLALYVDDDGPGVPDEALGKLFDVFYRSDPARRSPNQGSGLGLAIAAKAAARMGGSIRAENLPGGGLRIALELPLAKEEEE